MPCLFGIRKLGLAQRVKISLLGMVEVSAAHVYIAFCRSTTSTWPFGSVWEWPLCGWEQSPGHCWSPPLCHSLVVWVPPGKPRLSLLGWVGRCGDVPQASCSLRGVCMEAGGNGGRKEFAGVLGFAERAGEC